MMSDPLTLLRSVAELRRKLGITRPFRDRGSPFAYLHMEGLERYERILRRWADSTPHSPESEQTD